MPHSDLRMCCNRQSCTGCKDVANTASASEGKLRGQPKPLPPRDANREVEEVARWLRKRARRVDRAERRITHRQPRQILGQHGFEMRDPKNGSIAICRSVERRIGLLLERVTVHERVCAISYRVKRSSWDSGSRRQKPSHG